MAPNVCNRREKPAKAKVLLVDEVPIIFTVVLFFRPMSTMTLDLHVCRFFVRWPHRRGTWLQPIVLHSLLEKLSVPEDERRKGLTQILLSLGQE